MSDFDPMEFSNNYRANEWFLGLLCEPPYLFAWTASSVLILARASFRGDMGLVLTFVAFSSLQPPNVSY